MWYCGLVRSWIVRYEVAVVTNLTFHSQEPPFGYPFPPAETVVVEFEGRRFVWHAVPTDESGDDYWPVVTTMIEDPNDYESERLATERFLSAMSYWTDHRIEAVSSGAAGSLEETDRPVVSAPRRGLADHLSETPGELVVIDDLRLKLVFAYYREGLNTGSPLFKFLAFWNALDVACEDYEGGLPAWIRRRCLATRQGGEATKRLRATGGCV